MRNFEKYLYFQKKKNTRKLIDDVTIGRKLCKLKTSKKSQVKCVEKSVTLRNCPLRNVTFGYSKSLTQID